MDDGDSKQKKNSNLISDGWDVFQPLRIRYPFLLNKQFNQFLLDYHFYFLPAISILFWVILGIK
jgi:hypothetical protein